MAIIDFIITIVCNLRNYLTVNQASRYLELFSERDRHAPTPTSAA